MDKRRRRQLRPKSSKRRKEEFRAKPGNEGQWTERNGATDACKSLLLRTQVDPIFTVERPIEEGYVETAARMIEELGSGAFLSDFLARLRQPSRPLPAGTAVTDDRILARVEVHPHFAEEREAIIPEHQWIEAAIVQIAEIGPAVFIRELLENLKGNWVDGDGQMCPMAEAPTKKEGQLIRRNANCPFCANPKETALPVTQEDLSEARCHCSDPNCDSNIIEFSSECHPGADCRAFYCQKHGTLSLFCGECDSLHTTLQIAERNRARLKWETS